MSTVTALSRQVLDALGGADNIHDIENCMTRLRIGVRNTDAVDVDALKAIPKVLGVVPGPTMQVVLGPGLVDEVAGEMGRLTQVTVTEGDDPGTPASAGSTAPDATSATSAEALAARGEHLKAERKARNETPVKRLLRRVANIFLPLIPALIACGIIAGLNGVLLNLTTRGITPWAAGITPALAAMANGFMSLIAVFVGMNAAKEFGGTPILGGAVAAIIPFAGVAKVTVLGQALAPGQGGVIGALFAAVLAAFVERWCRRWCPRSIAMLVVPTVTVLVAGLVTLYVFMTLAGWIAGGIGVAANGLLQTGGAPAGFVLGGLFLPLVMFGLHQALIPIHTTLIAQAGYTILLPVLAMAGAGQVGASVAVYMRAKHNRSLRNTITSALPAGLLGVGEPLIYGVTLPLGRPFVTACIGGAFGGGFIGFFDALGTTVGSTAIGPSGWALFPLVTGDAGMGAAALVYGGGLLVGYLTGWAATYFFGFSAEALAALDTDELDDQRADLIGREQAPQA
ncbi:PTS transporter subunit EIIC [Mobilicoccus pelagius]|uniref:N-acetylmuramic acid-specific phosphotransferase system enzyme IIBC component n=1 Tax=Mobilicoccus pelagius NBRC 104925 TaxID=1089455 RepID=H5UMF3_9MICO|nr:PTS transporter subunit EIIC [Mobilicoccus pelagius]GAB46911.1 N-acetylmuramic acid-specific phosphotransferase system enzyme IIBC component [Mobilicoccus pelagius NBRC 104925]